MQPSHIWLLICLAWLGAEAKDFVCKGKTKGTIKIGEGDSSYFKIQSGAQKTKCSVTYKKKRTCPILRFSCSQFNIKNKKASCRGLDRMATKTKGKTENYCKGTGPDLKTSASLIVSFVSKKKSKSIATCVAECVSPTTTTATTTATTTTAATTTSTETTTTSAGVSCGPEACGLTCSAVDKCVENEEIVCVMAPCCPTWSCNETLVKTEGESCGSCFCPPTYSAGECEEGLTCVHDPNIADAPGICEKKAKKEGESCGSCFCPPTYSAGECEAGLTCVSNPNIPDLPGVCESITVPPLEA